MDTKSGGGDDPIAFPGGVGCEASSQNVREPLGWPNSPKLVLLEWQDHVWLVLFRFYINRGPLVSMRTAI